MVLDRPRSRCNCLIGLVSAAPPGQTNAMTRFRWQSLWAFVRAMFASDGRRGGQALAAVVLGALFEGLGIVLLVPIIGLVVSQGGLATGSGGLARSIGRFAGVFGQDRQTLLWLALTAFMLVMIMRGGVLYWRDRVTWRLQAGFVLEQRNRIVRKLAAARWSALVALEHARVMSQLGGEIGRIAVASTMLFQIIVALGMLLVQAVLVVMLAPLMGSIMIALFALMGLPVILRFRQIAVLGQHANRGGAELMANIGNLLNGLKVALAQGMQDRFIAEFERMQAEHFVYQRQFTLGRARDQLVFGIASAAAGALLVGLGLGVFRVAPANLLALIVVFTRLSGPVRTLQTSLPQLVYMLPAYQSITALAEQLDAARADDRRDLPIGDTTLAFEDAGYLHPQGRGLKRASFRIAPGDVVGICGASGGGKTTLLDLATGLIEPQQGMVTVGGDPLGPERLGSWARRIAYATQEPFLFHHSIRHNIGWGLDVDDAAIWRAVTAMGAHALVRALPQGLDTLVGERGALLSGGERQRLILARALLRAPRLLILDEATSSLDAPSEAAILAAFRALDPPPAILFVTHRAESLAQCDRVLRMEDGVLEG